MSVVRSEMRTNDIRLMHTLDEEYGQKGTEPVI
jgi:hypothetical protein